VYKVELSTIDVELSLIDDINKLLDATNAKRKQLQSQAIKVSDSLLDLTVDYEKIFALSINGANKAKDLGIIDAEKAFRVRAEEAKDYSNVVGKASNTITNTINQI
jgi:hypothetical protein